MTLKMDQGVWRWHNLTGHISPSISGLPRVYLYRFWCVQCRI